MTDNISECIELYIDYLRSLGKSENTRINYRVDLRHFRDYLEGQGITDAAEIDTRAVRIFLSSMLGVGDAKTSASRRLSAVRGFTSWLAETGRTANDPSAGMKGRRSPTLCRAPYRTRRRKASDAGPDERAEQYRRDRLVLELLYGAGLRVSELIGLTWDKVELDDRVLIVKGKGNKERMAPFGVPAQKLLEEWRDITCVDGGGPVFPSDKKGAERLTVRTVDRIVTRAARRVGLHGVTPHTLRHCYATHMLENGAPLKVVQDLLGHDSIAATQRYLRITPSQIKKSYLSAHPLASADESSETA